LEPDTATEGGSRGAASLRSLKVGGVTPFTATDFPGLLAAVVFVQGCPWRCGYCHNTHLQPRTRRTAVDWQDVMHLVSRRIGLIDGVVFSGGEPTSDPALAHAIGDIRKLGFKVGMHSAGTHPRRFERVLPLLNWVGFDVKAPFEAYERITRVRGSAEPARRSLEALLASGVDFECRTTAHPSLLSEQDLLTLAGTLAAMGVQRYALQVFRKQGSRDAALNAIGVSGYPSEATTERIRGLFHSFDIRRG
jgi:anaerobic ribonucleoside-triphosphate reductase activating protein